MDLAKVTSFLGGFLYLLLFGVALLFGQNLNNILSENFGVSDSSLFALILASSFLFAVGNFCFSYFIQLRENYHESMQNVLFFSLQLLLIPAIIFIGFIVIFSNLS